MSRREKLRKTMLEDIKAAARQQMADNGTAAVSMSGIARVLEVSQPALYRYYSSRDKLITALILDAYNDLAQTLETAADSLPKEAYGKRLMHVIMIYREWALAHPTDYQLIYGNPIPGYKAPEDVTIPAAQRGFAVILRLLDEAFQVGALRLPRQYQSLPKDLQISLPDMENGSEGSFPAAILYLGVLGWYRIHGMISLELYNHTRAVLPDTGAFYRYEMEILLNSLGLHS